MSSANDIPVVNVYGPGSQPDDVDAGLEIMPLPTSMSTFQAPLLPEPEETGDITRALAVLGDVASALASFDGSGSEKVFALDALQGDDLELLNQVLGVGEVSATISGAAPVEVQESVMAGLWRVRYLDSSGQLQRDCLEVAPIPQVVRAMAFQSARHDVNTRIDDLPAGTINSPSLLAELNDKVRQFRDGDPPHVINLSLLPLSAEDQMLIGERLGVGPVTILSRGYGNCRIGSTACHAVWWIKYYNSDDTLILNTIEVVDVPEVAIAAAEDIADSAHRLKEILEIYQ